jgi:pimeloyl-ACP methyl ester carboxylesterase
VLKRSSYAISPADETPIFYEVSEPPEAARGGAAESAFAAATPLAPAALTDGIGCDGYVWKYLRRDLERERRVLHWHYRGHGRSPLPRDPHRVAIADLADDLAAVLDDSGTEAAILFGHSMGVQVVLETYRRHSSRVRALVLLCGSPENPLRTFRGQRSLEVVLPRVRSAVERAPRLINQAARLLLPTRLAFSLAARLEVNAELLQATDFMPYLRGLSRVEMPFFLSMLAAAGEHSAVDLLPSIAVPVLIVAGERDGFTPPDLSRAMASAIPDAELCEVESGSHTAPLERPELVGRTVADFLARRVDEPARSEERGDDLERGVAARDRPAQVHRRR